MFPQKTKVLVYICFIICPRKRNTSNLCQAVIAKPYLLHIPKPYYVDCRYHCASLFFLQAHMTTVWPKLFSISFARLYNCHFIDKVIFSMFPNFFHNSINQFVLYGYYYAFLYGHVINVNKPRASQKSTVLAYSFISCKVLHCFNLYIWLLFTTQYTSFYCMEAKSSQVYK